MNILTKTPDTCTMQSCSRPGVLVSNHSFGDTNIYLRMFGFQDASDRVKMSVTLFEIDSNGEPQPLSHRLDMYMSHGAGQVTTKPFAIAGGLHVATIEVIDISGIYTATVTLLPVVTVTASSQVDD